MLNTKNLIASPSLFSKFSPSLTISQSPTMNKRNSAGLITSVILNKYTKNTSESDKQSSSKKSVDVEKHEENFKENELTQSKIPVKQNKNNLILIDNILNKKLDNNSVNPLKKYSEKYYVS